MIQNAASEDTEVASWEELLDLLRAEDLVQEWTLPACREAVEVQPDGRVRLRMATAARGAALYELTHARASAAWPAIAAAGDPDVAPPGDEPADVGDANEQLVPRFQRPSRTPRCSGRTAGMRSSPTSAHGPARSSSTGSSARDIS